MRAKIKLRLPTEYLLISKSLIFRITAGFGTLLAQVAGLHRAVPSTTLDKVFNCDIHYNSFHRFVNRPGKDFLHFIPEKWYYANIPGRCRERHHIPFKCERN